MPMNADEFLPNAETLSAIERDIDNYNQQRRYAKGEVARRMIGFFAPFTAGAAVLTYFLVRYHAAMPENIVNGLIGIMMIGGLGLAMYGHSMAIRIGEEIQQEFRDHILPVLFGFLDELHYSRR